MKEGSLLPKGEQSAFYIKAMYTVLPGKKPTGVWAKAAFIQTSLRGVEQRCPLPMQPWLDGCPAGS